MVDLSVAQPQQGLILDPCQPHLLEIQASAPEPAVKSMVVVQLAAIGLLERVSHDVEARAPSGTNQSAAAAGVKCPWKLHAPSSATRPAPAPRARVSRSGSTGGHARARHRLRVCAHDLRTNLRLVYRGPRPRRSAAGAHLRPSFRFHHTMSVPPTVMPKYSFTGVDVREEQRSPNPRPGPEDRGPAAAVDRSRTVAYRFASRLTAISQPRSTEQLDVLFVVAHPHYRWIREPAAGGDDEEGAWRTHRC